MSKVLGLDLGSNSIGWALIDNKKEQIIATGVRIFPAGVENLGDGSREVSKNASRTDARGARRQFFRRHLRKRLMLRELAKNNLCPIDFKSLKVWSNNDVFESKEFKNWVKLNPYVLRAKAINEKISLHEFGRILYHLIQRRGFQSNSRSAGDENTEKSVIFQGDTKTGKAGIIETQENLEKNKTLGSYLYSIAPKEGVAYSNKSERVRNRYTTRQMYIDEFEELWNKQSEFHNELTDELKAIFGGRKKNGYNIDGILFHQRPLRSQKHLIGKCTFEPQKTKCPISAIPFEEFRVHQWVNTVECNGEGLSQEDKSKLIKELFKKEKVTFGALRKALKKAGSEYQFNYKDDDKIVGTYTISSLSNQKFFGASWFDKNSKEQEDIWHVLYFFEDRDKLKAYAKTKWNFDEAKADKISKHNLKEGYSNLSRKAINNILPFLKRGVLYDKAVTLGGIKNAFGSKWETLPENDKNGLIDSIDDITGQGNKGGYIDDLKEHLKTEHSLNENELNKLYHHSANIESREELERLPLGKKADSEIQSLRNPVVIAALFELRKVVNELIDDHGKPDIIKIEMARDLKISKTKRYEIRKEQKRLEGENDRVKSELEKLNQNINHENILKYKLWEECNKICPYTGREISVTQLFSGEVQIEHIIPWSRSLNDSFMNKTLCFADENRAKGDLTPYEYYSKQGEDKWETIKTRALNCFKNKKGYPNAYAKFKHFIKTSLDGDFVSRQLNDTRYISREAKAYLEKICMDVQVSPGQATANLRQKWGLNTILNIDDTKSRDDHRHHAVDALVMTCTNRTHLQELSKWNRYNRSANLKEFPMPWSSFRQDTETAILNILVSHRKTDNLLTVRNIKTEKNGLVHKNKSIAARGQLHLETVYGKRKDPHSENHSYHVRKPITSLTPAEIPKIVDKEISKIAYDRITRVGLSVDEKNGKPIVKTSNEKKLFEQAFSEPLFLKNKNGTPVPIKKARIKKNFGNAKHLKTSTNINQWVDLGKNHHVLIYADQNGDLHEDVISFWEAVERKRQGLPVVQLPSDQKSGKIITTLQINDLFLLGLSEEDIDWGNTNNHKVFNKNLFRVQKLSSKFYEFRLSTESKIDRNDTPYYCRVQSFGEGKTGWKTFNPIKVKVTPTGKLFKA